MVFGVRRHRQHADRVQDAVRTVFACKQGAQMKLLDEFLLRDHDAPVACRKVLEIGATPQWADVPENQSLQRRRQPHLHLVKLGGQVLQIHRLQFFFFVHNIKRSRSH